MAHQVQGRRELQLPASLGVHSTNPAKQHQSDDKTAGRRLEKIMTYNEKCSRKYINSDHYKNLLRQ